MAFSRKLLNEDEFVVISTHTHVKALLGPALLLIVIAGAAGFLGTLPSGAPRDFLRVVIAAVALLAVAWFVVRPFLVWLSTTYTLTNRRLITRRGVLTRRGHDIPLLRISDVSYEHGLLDRVLGCGTLIVSDASERGRVELHDIPQVEQVHLQLSDLVFDGGEPVGDHRYRADDGA